MSSSDEAATVLVVDDEEPVADSFALRLGQRYETRTAYGGAAALEAVDDDVDVVLLDRRMPDISGDEVLSTVRERGSSCQVVMVTAVTPDLDVVDLPFDDYFVKPISGGSDYDAIERQLELAAASPEVAELAAVTAKLELLEEYGSREALGESDAYQRLTARAADLRSQLPEEATAGLDGRHDP